MADRVSLKLDGFKELREKLHPRKFEKRLQREVRKATMKVGLLAERRITQDINRGRVKPSRLSGLTIALKGSTRALVDTGQLLQSIVSQVIAWHTVIVGVLKNRAVRDEITGEVKDLIVIAKILHDGANVPVTPKMRAFFLWLANGAESPVKGKVHPLSPGTRMIHVPARPFMKGVIDKKMRERYRKVWQKAVDKALKSSS